MKSVIALKMFDSQDFMGFTPDEALRAWELRAMKEKQLLRDSFFFLREAKSHFFYQICLFCVQKKPLQRHLRCLQTYSMCVNIFTKMLQMNHP